MLCAHRAAGREVKDTTNPHETLPYICLLLRPSSRPPNTHKQIHIQSACLFADNHPNRS